jgi:hypothetical protein
MICRFYWQAIKEASFGVKVRQLIIEKYFRTENEVRECFKVIKDRFPVPEGMQWLFEWDEVLKRKTPI